MAMLPMIGYPFGPGGYGSFLRKVVNEKRTKASKRGRMMKKIGDD